MDDLIHELKYKKQYIYFIVKKKQKARRNLWVDTLFDSISVIPLFISSGIPPGKEV
jgi:hypothetical protein